MVVVAWMPIVSICVCMRAYVVLPESQLDFDLL